MDSKVLANLCAQAASEKKAADIVIMKVKEITSFTDYFVLCTGSNEIQLKAIKDNVEEIMAKKGIEPSRIEGKKESGWILMDYSDVVLHIFMPDERSYYDLEKLWGDADFISGDEE